MINNNEKKHLIIEAISKYILCADYMCKLLKDEFGIVDEPLLMAYRQKMLPKTGYLNELTNFDFHGAGCYFEFEGGSIEIDFGPNGRCDGFDAYRIHDFINSTLKWDNLIELTQENIAIYLEELFNEGIIMKFGLYPNPDLYYLNPNSKPTRD
jgi:hypothetical protein